MKSRCNWNYPCRAWAPECVSGIPFSDVRTNPASGRRYHCILLGYRKRQKRKLQDQKWILCTRCHSVSCRGSFCVYHGWNICKFPRPYRGSTIPEYAVFCRSGKWNCCIVCVVYSPFQNGRRKEINKAGGGFFFEEN